MTYRVDPLREDHDLAPFDCGKAELSQWLKSHALHATRQGTRTYLLIDEDLGSVTGYFAIAPHMVARGDIPARIGRGAPAQIPAILLAKLALDSRVQGRGLGTDLLIKALEVIVEAARIAGGKVVVVDAIDERARAFYQLHDFQVVPGDPSRLVAKISSIAKALELRWT